MDSTQNISGEPAEFNTSIGIVRIQAEAGDGFSVRTVGDAHPLIYLAISPDDDDHWEMDRAPLYYAKDGEKAVPPPALIKELFELGTRWADAHPEEFERAAARDFDDGLSHATHYCLDQVLETLKATEEALTKLLAGEDAFGEFNLQAPPPLREVVENAAKMFHAMGLQAEAAGEAIREAAAAFTGRQIVRPGPQLFRNARMGDEESEGH
jgi:hypothetical protein